MQQLLSSAGNKCTRSRPIGCDNEVIRNFESKMDNHWFSIYYSHTFCSRLFIDYRNLCATYLFSTAPALAASSCEVSADSFAFTHMSVQADLVQLVYTHLKIQIKRHKETETWSKAFKNLSNTCSKLPHLLHFHLRVACDCKSSRHGRIYNFSIMRVSRPHCLCQRLWVSTWAWNHSSSN